MDAEVLRILKLGRARIAAGWCQKYFSIHLKNDWLDAKMKAKMKFDENNPPDACFCAWGALQHHAPPGGDAIRRALLLMEGIVGGPVHAWNDHPDRTQQDVIYLYDRAIAEVIKS